jgi:hypothetical protein
MSESVWSKRYKREAAKAAAASKGTAISSLRREKEQRRQVRLKAWVEESAKLTELRAMLTKAISDGDDATEVELEAAITHQEQAEASLW